MNLIFRLLYILIKAVFGKRLRSPLEKSIITLRVFPNDLDFNLHMNNGRYLTIMDLGRFDLTIIGKFYPVILKNKLLPVVASETIRFKKSLKLFQKFSLETQIIGWDEKWFFMKQTFFSNGEIVAEGLVKGALKNRKNTFSPNQIINKVYPNSSSPELPEKIIHWLKADELLATTQ